MLTVDRLSVWYDENNFILKEVSFDIEANTIIGLLGLNGAGKTTLINTISGVHSGYSCFSITKNNQDIKFDDITWKKERYTVFTEEQAFSYWSFNEYKTFIERVYKKKLDDLRVSQLVKGFGFEKYLNYYFKDLSTGNRKKAFLIIGFALELPLLILDEPLDGLDYLASEYLYKEIIEYKKYGSVLMSSHIAESIEKTCDKLLVLNEGKIESYKFESGDKVRDLLEGWLNDIN